MGWDVARQFCVNQASPQLRHKKTSAWALAARFVAQVQGHSGLVAKTLSPGAVVSTAPTQPAAPGELHTERGTLAQAGVFCFLRVSLGGGVGRLCGLSRHLRLDAFHQASSVHAHLPSLFQVDVHEERELADGGNKRSREYDPSSNGSDGDASDKR